MRITIRHVSSAIFVSVMALSAAGQTLAATAGAVQDQLPTPAAPMAQSDSSAAPVTYAIEQLRSFTEADVKFNLRDLMDGISFFDAVRYVQAGFTVLGTP